VRPSVCWMLALLVAGCGLSDYEERMREAQLGVERCDADAGLEVPLGPSTSAEVPDIFFRPPRGLVVTDKGTQTKGTYHLGRKPGETGPVSELFVTVSQARPTEVAGGIEKILRPPGRDPLIFRQNESYGSGDDESGYSQWVLQNLGQTQVTLLYRTDKDRLTEAASQIEKSTRSLTVDEGVEAARRAYTRWGKGTAK
jgi:hypothetical protein